MSVWQNNLFLALLVVVSGSLSPPRSDDESPLAERVVFRYVEHFSQAFLSELTDWELEILETQSVLDGFNDDYIPLQTEDEGELIEMSPLGIIDLAEIMYRGYESVVYSARTIRNSTNDLVVKYQAMCSDLGKAMLHPLVTDYWFLNEAFELGIAPQPLFLSPPILLGDMMEKSGRKIPFRMTPSELDDCIEDGGVVRFLVMQKSRGVSLAEYRQRFTDGILPIHVASDIMLSIIHVLRHLHEAGLIVHGDIHLGNIMIEQDANGKYLVSLIDFGRAMRDYRNLSNDRIDMQGYWSHQLCSPWQMDGRAWARRDDVYKAVAMFGAMINPYEYYVREAEFLKSGGIAKAIRIKRNAFFFVLPPPVITPDQVFNSQYDSIAVALGGKRDDQRVNSLVKELRNIQKLVTVDLDDINSPIDYMKIYESFRWVKALVRPLAHL